jgi:hypothetical protein
MHHHLDTLSAVGIGTNIVTTEAEAVGALYRHGLRNTDPDATEVLILADADRWITAVISGGMVRSLRRLRSDANNFEQTCRDCQQSIASAGSLSDVRRVWWCGGAALDAARSRLAELLGVPVEPVDIGISRQRQSTTSSGSIGPEHLATYGPAIGLALAGLFERDEILRLYDRAAADRAPRASRLERVMSYPWRWAGVAAVFTMLAAVMHVGALYGEVRNMQHLIDQAGNVPVTNKLGDAPELEPKIRALSRLEAYRIDVERIVAALCLFTPDSIIISSLSISREKRMTLKGTAQDAKAIFTLTEALENDSRFNAVTPEQTAAGKEKTFTLTAELPGVTKLTTATGRGASWR